MISKKGNKQKKEVILRQGSLVSEFHFVLKSPEREVFLRYD